MSVYEKMTTLANVIREKTGGTEKLSIDKMITEVSSLQVGGSTEEEWIGDGNTHIWITLHEGRTSPMLGVCPNGTVTVDWGDGTTPDVLTGRSTISPKWTPTHEYASVGEYVISLSVDGIMCPAGTGATHEHAYILRYSSSADLRNLAYENSVQRIEIGDNVTSIDRYAFYKCYSLASITMSNSVTNIGERAFHDCQALASITMPNSVTSIGDRAFSNCQALASITIPNSVTSIGNDMFYNCCSLASITMPNSVTSIGNYAFQGCCCLTSITIPSKVISIGNNAFSGCVSVRYYDFSKHTVVPTLSNSSAFDKIADDCEIRVPTALYDEWIAATNWATYASKIVAV